MTAGEFKRIYLEQERHDAEDDHLYSIVRHFSDDLFLSDLMLMWLHGESKRQHV